MKRLIVGVLAFVATVCVAVLVTFRSGAAQTEGAAPASAPATQGPSPNLTFVPPAPSTEQLIAQTVVVYNNLDLTSTELANFYMEKRGIPKSQMVGITTAASEEIGRAEYDTTIADPLRKIFVKNGWWKLNEGEGPKDAVVASRIRFVVLMRGIPLKIAPQPELPPDPRVRQPPQLSMHNEASVDSELSVLGVGGHPLAGLVGNPYYESSIRFTEFRQAPLLLVCRLDAPTPAMVKQMISDSVQTERSGLEGMAYVDARGISDPGYKVGDEWLFNVAANARTHGFPVVLDTGPGLFPDAYPMRHTAVYFGWYAEHASGPFKQPGFQFERGAVAVHIHSFSAFTLRDVNANWCGPLVAAGAACTVGSVYEPYLDFTPHVDILFDRLVNGFTFAEASYASVRGLSWMTTFIGDPLYRPFAFLYQNYHPKDNDEWAAYRAGAVQWFRDQAAGESALNASIKRLQSGVIAEGLGLLEVAADRKEQAVQAFDEARKLYKNPDDSIRVAVHEIGVLKAMGRAAEAFELARKEEQAHSKSRGVEVLEMLEPSRPKTK